MNPKTQLEKGSTIILVLGVLALISLIGTALLFISRNEQKESKRYSDESRAQFVVESGVEAALAYLSNPNTPLAQQPVQFLTEPNNPSVKLEHLKKSSYGAFDLDGDGRNEISGIVSETYAPNGDRYRLRVISCQGRLNINDSNDPVNEDSDPYVDQITPERDWNLLPAHMKKPNSVLDPVPTPLNRDPDWLYPGDADFELSKSPAGKPYPKARGRLEILLAALLKNIFPAHPNADFARDTAAFMLNERESRYGGKFGSFAELENALTPSKMTMDEWSRFKNQITLNAWQDSDVLKPSFQWCISRPGVLPYFYHGDIKPGIGFSNCIQPQKIIGEGSIRPVFTKIYAPQTFAIPPMPPLVFNPNPAFPSWDTDNDQSNDVYIYSDMQTSHFEKAKRSPVNVNTASIEMLKALIEPVTGWYLKEAPALGEGATAEDWSSPGSGFWGRPPYHPWYWAGYEGAGPYLSHFILPWSNWPGFLDGYYPNVGAPEYNHFFYDELALAVSDQPFGSLFSNTKPIHLGKNGRFGELKTTKLETAIAESLALDIYQRIHPSPDTLLPFCTWEEFEDFLLSRVEGDGGADDLAGFDIYMAHALIANFNPNARVNDVNPNKGFFLHVDKSQLGVNTAELCFHEFGTYEIQSLGEICDAENNILGRRKTRAVVSSALHMLRLTTQAQFMEGYNPISGGKQASDFCTPANGVSATSGLRFVSGLQDDSYIGHSIQSYPEPEINACEKVTGNVVFQNHISNSHMDGYLMLSVIRPAEDELFYGAGGIRFYAPMNGNYDSLLGGSTEGRHYSDFDSGHLESPSCNGIQWSPDKFSTKRTLMASAGVEIRQFERDPGERQPANLPDTSLLFREKSLLTQMGIPAGNLYPDGAFSDVGRTLKYDAGLFGNPAMQLREGSMQFWIKPGFDLSHANRIRQFFTAAPKDVESVYVGEYFFGHPNSYSFSKKVLGDEFAMYYFAHGGPRVPNPLEDNFVLYDPQISTDPADCFATRSLYMHAMNPKDGLTYNEHVGMGTVTVNQSWKAAYAPNPANAYFHFETRQWSHISFGWQFPDTMGPLTVLNMAMNGKPVENDRLFSTGRAPFPFGILADGSRNYMRFGESSSAPFRNNPADSTYGSISSSANFLDVDLLGDDFKYGRYYAEGDGCYLSPEIDLFSKLKLDASKARLVEVSWTAYVPKQADPSFKPNHPRFNDLLSVDDSNLYVNPEWALRETDGLPCPSDPMSGKWGKDFVPFSFDFVNPKTGSWYYDEKGLTKPAQKPNFAGGSRDSLWSSLEWKTGDKFKFRVHFNTGTHSGLLASPVLDDISFFFESRNHQIMLWENEFSE